MKEPHYDEDGYFIVPFEGESLTYLKRETQARINGKMRSTIHYRPNSEFCGVVGEGAAQVWKGIPIEKIKIESFTFSRIDIIILEKTFEIKSVEWPQKIPRFIIPPGKEFVTDCGLLCYIRVGTEFMKSEDWKTTTIATAKLLGWLTRSEWNEKSYLFEMAEYSTPRQCVDPSQLHKPKEFFALYLPT